MNTDTKASMGADSLPALTRIFEWVKQRMKQAERCERAAAKRWDHVRALRFQHEHDALLPVLLKLSAEMGAAKKRQPAKNAKIPHADLPDVRLPDVAT